MLEEIEDPELKALAGNLPAAILHSRVNSTVQKYLRAYRRWKVWASDHGLDPIPAKPYQFVLYLQHLGEESHSKATVEVACNAVTWIHATAGLASITAHPFVKATLEDLQRTLEKPITKKELITVDMLAQMQRSQVTKPTSGWRQLVYWAFLASLLSLGHLRAQWPCGVLSHKVSYAA